MRALLLALLAGTTISAQDAARQPSSLDEPMEGEVRVVDIAGGSPCRLWTQIEQVARHAGVRIGFEQTFDCTPAGWTRRAYGAAVALDGLTPRQAFDLLLSTRPDYRWAEIDGVAVIRPAAAWRADGSVLNRHVPPFTVRNLHVHHVLHGVFQSMQPSMFQEHTDLGLSTNSRRHLDPHSTAAIDVPVSIAFPGGTLLEALNAMTRPLAGTWQAAYGKGHEDLRRLWLTVHTLDYDGGAMQHMSLPFRVPKRDGR